MTAAKVSIAAPSRPESIPTTRDYIPRNGTSTVSSPRDQQAHCSPLVNPVLVNSASNAHCRQMHPRTHSHSLSVGSINPAHRVTRRKSISSTASSNAAVVAAVVKEAMANTIDPAGFSSRRNSKNPGKASQPPFPSSLPVSSGFNHSGFESGQSSAVTDGPPLSSLPESDKVSTKSRTRRASEGSRLGKGDSKRTSTGELKCEKCGKGYKHSSCLTKHLWEHTPEWALTSKLLISKHQQVQLLEAASVLVAMNQEASSSVESETSSPAASGSSDPHSDDMSSTDTTPPPQTDESHANGFNSSKRFSNNSSVYSHSYQSSIFSESAPSTSRPYMSHYRQWSSENRPTTSGTSVAGSYISDEEQADLAAAVGLLSCSFGTPKTGPVMLPADVPPVPPLPAQFLGQKADRLSGSTITITATNRDYDSYVRERKDVEMEDDDDFETNQGVDGERHDDDEEGMFGKMEE